MHYARVSSGLLDFESDAHFQFLSKTDMAADLVTEYKISKYAQGIAGKVAKLGMFSVDLASQGGADSFLQSRALSRTPKGLRSPTSGTTTTFVM